MTHQQDYPNQTPLAGPQSLNSNASKQQDQHVRSILTSPLNSLSDPKPPNARRGGFNSDDFASDSPSNPSSSVQQTNSYLSTSSANQQIILLPTRQRIYHIIDSALVTSLVFFLMAVDVCCFQAAYLYILRHSNSPLLNRLYIILDWVLVVVYLSEVNIRLYAYGPQFYFHGALRCLDYVIASANAICIVSYSIYLQPWLLAIRFIRILRMVTALTAWRERKLKGRTRQQLQSLAELLEKEKSEHSKLTKWKIEPDAIAIGERAGQGGFGTVFSGLFRGTLVAVKKVSYPDHKQVVSSIEDEAITLVNLRHPNVVLFMGFLHEPSQLWIVTEYCSRGSLRDLLDNTNQPISEGKVLKLALGAARGLAYLHGQDPPVLHLDLKTSNVLISSGWDAKLGDFGLSRSIDKIEKSWFSGTMQYAAPEILESNVFSTAADIYSFGICLWEMAAREVPYQGLSPMAVLWGVVKTKLRPSLKSIKVADMKSSKSVAKDESFNNTPSFLESEPQRKHQTPIRISNSAGNNPKDVTGTEPRTCAAKKETVIALDDLNSPPPQDRNRDSTLEIRIFEGVEENDKTGVVGKDPVAANIVEGIVFPSTVNSADKTSIQGSQKGQEDVEPGSLSQPRKKRSLFRDQTRLSKTENRDVHLSDLSHKVTQTIQMFDERPPMIRKKEEEGSQEHVVQSRTESVAGSVSGGLSGRAKRNVIEKSSLRVPRQLSQLKSSKRIRGSGLCAEIGSRRDEKDPFLRRLASVSNRPKQNSTSGGTGMEAESDGRKGHESPAASTNFIEDKNAEVTPPSVVSQPVVPNEYVDLIQKCWSHDPKDRPSAGEIVWRLVILTDALMKEK